MALNIQIFGRRDSRDSQKAVRFFKERRTPFSFVDITRRPPAAAELQRFSQRFGARALLDTQSKAYAQSGLGYMRLDDEEAFQRVLSDPRLLRLPLIRAGNRLTIGPDEEAWRSWLTGEAQ